MITRCSISSVSRLLLVLHVPALLCLWQPLTSHLLRTSSPAPAGLSRTELAGKHSNRADQLIVDGLLASLINFDKGAADAITAQDEKNRLVAEAGVEPVEIGLLGGVSWSDTRILGPQVPALFGIRGMAAMLIMLAFLARLMTQLTLSL